MSEVHRIPPGPKFKDLTGMKFGRWTVESFGGKKGHNNWNCRCDCGNEKVVCATTLLANTSKSCGCLRSDFAKSKAFVPKIDGKRTAEHNIYHLIRFRCFNNACRCYHRYGGRGITVCKRWRESFLNFLADMGRRPSKKHSIDRIDNNGSYTCGKCDECVENEWTANCRWATPSQQIRNQERNHRITFCGETLCVTDWANRLGLKVHTIIVRLIRGWTAEEALTITSSGHGRKRRELLP
jgi:hypothetical protein